MGHGASSLLDPHFEYDKYGTKEQLAFILNKKLILKRLV
jgi:hypothetical protein